MQKHKWKIAEYQKCKKASSFITIKILKRIRFTNAYYRPYWLPKNLNSYNPCSIEFFTMPNISTIFFKTYLMGLSCFSYDKGCWM